MSKKQQTGEAGTRTTGPLVLCSWAPLRILQRFLTERGRLSMGLLALASVALLLVAFSPFDCWYLGYVALVPWALAIEPGRQSQQREQ